jgi:hypothetical protein
VIQKITSLQNTLVKRTAELKNKKNRQKDNTFFLEGKRAIEEALTGGWEIEALFFTAQYDQSNIALAETKAPCYLVDEYVMNKMASTEHPQSIGAVIHQKQSTLAEVQNKEGLLLVLDGVMDPGNLGTIIRTADAAQAMGVVFLIIPWIYLILKLFVLPWAQFSICLLLQASAKQALKGFLPKRGYLFVGNVFRGCGRLSCSSMAQGVSPLLWAMRPGECQKSC